MINHLLIALALLSFSIVSHAAAVPTDADQAVKDAITNAVLHKEVTVIQGGDSDKDVAAVLTLATMATCSAEACNNANTSLAELGSSVENDWFVLQGGSSPSQPIVVLLFIVGLIALFLARKSVSTK